MSSQYVFPELPINSFYSLTGKTFSSMWRVEKYIRPYSNNSKWVESAKRSVSTHLQLKSFLVFRDKCSNWWKDHRSEQCLIIIIGRLQLVLNQKVIICVGVGEDRQIMQMFNCMKNTRKLTWTGETRICFVVLGVLLFSRTYWDWYYGYSTNGIGVSMQYDHLHTILYRPFVSVLVSVSVSVSVNAP